MARASKPQAITRADVLRAAKAYVDVPPWRPLRDEVVFDGSRPSRTFHSAFVTAGREYRVFPYVYGGMDTPETFRRRIAEGACPGGWDRVSGHGTSHWQSKRDGGFGLRLTAPRRLAGVDCSAYVSNAWGLPRAWSTFELPQICVRVRREDLRPGDILNRRWSHVRLFERADGEDRVRVYESRGGEGRRPWREGDEQGCVLHHSVPWDPQYIPMTPFPVLLETAAAMKRVRAVCGSKGKLEILAMTVDGSPVAFRAKHLRADSRGLHRVEAAAVLRRPLLPGSHESSVVAVNRVAGQSFRDERSWTFRLE